MVCERCFATIHELGISVNSPKVVEQLLFIKNIFTASTNSIHDWGVLPSLTELRSPTL